MPGPALWALMWWPADTDGMPCHLFVHPPSDNVPAAGLVDWE